MNEETGVMLEASSIAHPPREWDGEYVISSSLIILLSSPTDHSAPASSDQFHAMGIEDEPSFTVALSQFSKLAKLHESAVFACADAGHWYDRLSKMPGNLGAEAILAMSKLIGDSRLIDLMCLDRVLRSAEGDVNLRPRSLSDLMKTAAQNSGGAAGEPATDDLHQELRAPHRQVCCLFLARMHSLGQEAELPQDIRLIDQLRTRPPANPKYDQGFIQRRMHARLSPQPSSVATTEPKNAIDSVSLLLAQAAPAARMVNVEIKAAMAAASMRDPTHSGLAVTRDGVSALRKKAQELFDQASAHLHADQDARACFEWADGERPPVELNNKGYIVDNGKELRNWLRKRANELVDDLGEPIDLPRDAEGFPPLNLERWGVWTSGDRLLAAVRSLRWSAAILRMRRDDETGSWQSGPITPSSVMAGDSPLGLYRTLGVPILTAPRGKRLVTFRLNDLVLTSYVAIAPFCFRRPEVLSSPPSALVDILRQRCADYFRDPITTMARRLWIVERDATTSQVDAEGEFDRTASDNSKQFQQFVTLTNGLFHAAIFGVPIENLETYLETEFGLAGRGTSEFARLMEHLVSQAVADLGSLRDSTDFLLATRISTVNQPYYGCFVNLENQRTSGSQHRRMLAGMSGGGRRPAWARLLQNLGPNRRADRFRARSLGGRLTPWASQVSVRSHQVRMTAEELRVEFIWRLMKAGFTIVAVTPDEILTLIEENRELDRRFTSGIHFDCELIPAIRTDSFMLSSDPTGQLRGHPIRIPFSYTVDFPAHW